jgi:hypothetical protein
MPQGEVHGVVDAAIGPVIDDDATIARLQADVARQQSRDTLLWLHRR